MESHQLWEGGDWVTGFLAGQTVTGRRHSHTYKHRKTEHVSDYVITILIKRTLEHNIVVQ